MRQLKWTGVMAMVLAASLWAARPAVAGTVQPKHVDADAKWYIHLDVEGAKQTQLWSIFLDAVRAQMPLDDVLDQVKATIGINPLTDINGVTIYSTTFEKDIAAILVYAKMDQLPLQQALASNPEYKGVQHGKHTIHTWLDANDGKHKAGAFFGEGLAILGDKVETVKAALDVLDGTKKGSSALVKEQPKTAFAYAAANLAESQDKNISRLLSASEAAQACISETDGKIGISVVVTAKSAEEANNIKMLADGLRAMVKMAAADQPTAAKLIGSIAVTVDGAKISARAEHEAKTLLKTIQDMAAEKAASDAKKQPGGAAPKQ